jgi:predicted ATPase/class 3 adenylate cyclase
LTRGLSLWRGPALSGLLDRGWARAAAVRLEELRSSAEDDRAAALLAAGDAAPAVAALTAAVIRDPLRERSHVLLMQALHQSGRQGEALRVFAGYRRRLADELGLEPGAAIGALDREIAAGGRDAPSGTSPVEGRRPTGTVTLLFTDLEDSTRQWDAHPAAMAEAVARHDHLVRRAIASRGGFVFATGGDGFGAAFPRAREALLAAVGAQRALLAEPWPHELSIRARMGLHTGETEERDDSYFGTTVNRAARVMAMAPPGQILCSSAVRQVVVGGVPIEGLDFVDLGPVRLTGLPGWERVFGVATDGVVAPGGPLEGERARLGDMPVLAGRVIGRGAVLGDLTNLLTTERLLTLTGPGGVGKTTVAVAAASESAVKFPGGAWWAELAPLSAGDDVAPVVAAALGVRQRAGVTGLESLATALADERLVVVLDNCEHVLESAAEVAATLLRRCPGVVVLATSRHRLGIPSEREVAIRPLAVDGDAVDLLVERIGRPELADDLVHRPLLVTISAALDGMPLALELAAARCRTMPLADVAARLEDRFRLLDRTADGRARSTLRGTVQWSYDLLGPVARTVYERLSVFAGPFTLDAAEAVAGFDLDQLELDDAVAALVEDSLLDFDGAWYRMLETTRGYAWERLVARGAGADLLARRERWVIGMVRAAHEGLRGPAERWWVDRLDGFWPDVRAVFLQALGRDDPDVAVDLVIHLVFESFFRRPEGFGWALRAVEQFGDRPHPLRHELLGAAGVCAWASGDPQRARALGEEAFVLEPDPVKSLDQLAAFSAGPQGSAWCGDIDGAIAIAERTLAAVEHDRYARAFWAATLQVGYAMAGTPAAGHERARRAIADADAIGNPTLRSYTRWAYAAALTGPTDSSLAGPYLDEAVELGRQVDSTWLLDEITGVLIMIGPPEAAEERLGQAVSHAARRLRLGYTMHAWSEVTTVALVLLQLGRLDDAFVLLAAAQRSPVGPALDRVLIQPMLGFLRTALTPERTAELEGRATALELPALLDLARDGSSTASPPTAMPAAVARTQ